MNINRKIRHYITQNHNYYDLSFRDLYRFIFFYIRPSCNLAWVYRHSRRTYSLKVTRLQYKVYCWQLWTTVEWIHRTDTSVTFPNAVLVWYKFKIFTKGPVEILIGTFHGVTQFLQQNVLHNLKLCNMSCITSNYAITIFFHILCNSHSSYHCMLRRLSLSYSK
jgi:hypothetical protein